MTHILRPDGSDDRRRANDQFLDLLLNDQELLRTEFAAIVAATWSNPPPTRPEGR